jgi:hypothetical protein
MPSEPPLDPPSQPQDLWDAPPLEIDPELIETSQRLVALSDAVYGSPTCDQPLADAELTENPHLLALETRNKYLFNRNVVLVAKVADLEAANLRLQEQISALKQSNSRSESPWYLRWLKF